MSHMGALRRVVVQVEVWSLRDSAAENRKAALRHMVISAATTVNFYREHFRSSDLTFLLPVVGR